MADRSHVHGLGPPGKRDHVDRVAEIGDRLVRPRDAPVSVGNLVFFVYLSLLQSFRYLRKSPPLARSAKASSLPSWGPRELSDIDSCECIRHEKVTPGSK